MVDVSGIFITEMNIMTVNRFIVAVLQEEVSRFLYKGTGRVLNQVFYTGKNFNKTQNVKRFGKGQRDDGRIIFRSKGSGFGFSSGVKRTGNCQWCNFFNYWERECRKKKVGEFRFVLSAEVNIVRIIKKDKISFLVLYVKYEEEGNFDDSDESLFVVDVYVLTVCMVIIRVSCSQWFIDSGVSAYICGNKECFIKY